MSILSSLFEKIQQEKEQKQSAKSKLMDFEKMIADQARSQGMLPRTYLEQLCQQSESFANSQLVKVLLGERDVPTQKGRDAKPEVLTKRAMNVVKKGIKQAANKQRRRMDKDSVKEQGFVKGMKMPRPGDNISTQDKMKMLQAIKQKRIQHSKMAPGLAKDKLSGEILDMMANAKVLLQSVGEDVKDQFTKLINPMGQDSTSLEKIKQSPGFHKLISTMFASGTQADMEWDEIFSAMSKMLNMNPMEIKAILQQDGFEFTEPDAETKFKQNMSATGGFQIGKGKSRTLNSMYEGSLDQFRNLYKKSIGSDDAAVTLRELIQAINDDSLWSDQFPQLKQFTGVSPQSGSRIVTAKKIPGDSADEKIAALVKAIDDDEWVNDTAKHLMKSFTLGEDEHQDRGYAQMIIQQHQDEYKKFMDTGDLMDAPTIYEKLFAYFSSSDADDMMPYGTQKARDGDPYVWLVNKLDELGLIIEEGNEFAQKVRQLKATGAKKGTKFKTSDGEEHTLEQILTQTRQLMDMLERKIQEQSPVEEDKTDAEIDDFHRELDQLVHKHFGHSSDEKREKVKEDAITEQEFDEAAGKKDACYHKVKARYKVWPSAYASGALVQCRKKGAANWGNKSD